MLYVQYGCGLASPEGWVNFDASPTVRMQRLPLLGAFAPGPKFPKSVRYGNIALGLPLADATVDAVYCSHVLEHLAFDDLRRALKNTFRILRSQGVFRLVLPDLRLIAERHVASTAPDAADKFMRESLLGLTTRPKGLSGLLRSWLGNSNHLWMWDFASLSAELQAAGFTAIRRAALGDYADPEFQRVEDPERWSNNLGIHCVKP
jgi:SAM-dependent methyltransferase